MVKYKSIMDHQTVVPNITVETEPWLTTNKIIIIAVAIIIINIIIVVWLYSSKSEIPPPKKNRQPQPKPPTPQASELDDVMKQGAEVLDEKGGDKTSFISDIEAAIDNT